MLVKNKINEFLFSIIKTNNSFCLLNLGKCEILEIYSKRKIN